MLYTFIIISFVTVGILLAAVPSLVWFLCWIVGKCLHGSVPYAPFGWTALGLVAMAWLILTYGFLIGRFQLEIKNFEYVHKDLPQEYDGFKIVQISDLHLSTFDDRHKALQRIVDSINAQKPDLICFTGDLVTMGVSEAEPYTEILRQLHATDGVVSVLGNHDFLLYNHQLKTEAERNDEVERLAEYERNMLVWKLLRNENYTIRRIDPRTNDTSTLTILGVDNSSCDNDGFHTIYAGDLPKAMDGTNGYRILLTHDPAHWRAEAVGQDIALTLSGHTHSGQVRCFGKALSDVSFKESAGWFYAGDQALYINSGLGCTLPIRLNCPAEITVIRLKK